MKRLAVLALLAAGCVDFDGKYEACVRERRCTDELPGVDAGQDAGQPDSGTAVVVFPPAAVWVSSGGGASTSAQGALGMCLGGVSSPGVSTAPSGATLTWGLFSSSANE